MAETKAPSGWSRRKFVGAAALLAAAIGVPIAAIRLADYDDEEAPNERQRELFGTVSDLVIPRTTTPGAVDVAVGDFVLLGLAHGLERSRAPWPVEAGLPGLDKHRRADGSLRMANWLEAELDDRADGDFLARDSAARAEALAALDGASFAQGAPNSPWKTIKALILTGYYTSEAGGARELRYELVPGRYDSKVPLKPGDAAFSSDWSAVDFG